jgi:undecaprenyl-diphosphatase
MPSSRILGVIVLGVIQGVTEFLPVSSSGHLVIGSLVFKLAEPSMLLDIVLHIGTLLPVLWLYRMDLWAMIRSLASLPKIRERWSLDPGLRLAVTAVVATIPTGLMGVFGKSHFEALFASPRAVSIALMITGVILMLTRLRPQSELSPEEGFRSLGLGRALAIGVAQGIAITPGISRSGTTIAAALLLGVEREMAAKFSFVLSIPAIIGAVVLELLGGSKGDPWRMEYLWGIAASMLIGYLALIFVVQMVKRGRVYWFSFYLWPVGLGLLIYTLVS